MRKKMGKKNIYAQSDAALDEVSAWLRAVPSCKTQNGGHSANCALWPPAIITV
jgi:hypothetical protein